MIFYIIFACVTLVATAEATNYCDPLLCYTGKHIACGHTGQLDSSQCPVGARNVNLIPNIETILHSHNEKRELIASGNLTGYGPAANMATMQWDKELAYLASLNVMQCRMKHDECRNTHNFKYSGQNLGAMYYGRSESSYNDTYIIQVIVNTWFNEHQKCNMTYMNSFPGVYTPNGAVIGHFTEMVVDKNARIGCGASRYSKNNMNWFLFGCNYSASHFRKKPVYRTSQSAASGCSKGVNPIYPSLCSIAEVYNPNSV